MKRLKNRLVQFLKQKYIESDGLEFDKLCKCFHAFRDIAALHWTAPLIIPNGSEFWCDANWAKRQELVTDIMSAKSMVIKDAFSIFNRLENGDGYGIPGYGKETK